MSATFDWKAAPSDKPAQTYKRPDLKPRRLHMYQAAKASEDSAREAEISQTNRELERHFELAQTTEDMALRAYHRDEAVLLASKVRLLVAQRSPAYVARLEAERGLD